MLGSLLIRNDGDVGDVVSSSPTFNYGAVLTANIESEDTELNFLASTLFIEPPLDELNVNGTYLNGTIITCEQSQFIELSFTITIAGSVIMILLVHIAPCLLSEWTLGMCWSEVNSGQTRVGQGCGKNPIMMSEFNVYTSDIST